MDLADAPTIEAIAAENGIPEGALRAALRHSHPDASPSEVLLRAGDYCRHGEIIETATDWCLSEDPRFKG